MLLFITALTASDAPLKPKNIAISLSARWPATPLAAEAAEFMADEGLFYKFVEGMSTTTPAKTDRAQLETIETVATNLLSPLGLRTLRGFSKDLSGEPTYDEFQLFVACSQPVLRGPTAMEKGVKLNLFE